MYIVYVPKKKEWEREWERDKRDIESEKRIDLIKKKEK